MAPSQTDRGANRSAGHSPERGVELSRDLVECFAVNERMNQIVLEHLDPAAWSAQPAGRRSRTIAAIFTHVHNVRRKWIRLSAPHLKIPAALDRSRCTQKQARAAMEQSGVRCAEMISEALAKPTPTSSFLRDGWARPWAPGAAMVAYMISHEAHHRGQVCMLAHQLGYPLATSVGSGMWAWERLWKEPGFTRRR
jgi:uncharacterized damage-inducible protein DinB